MFSNSGLLSYKAVYNKAIYNKAVIISTIGEN